MSMTSSLKIAEDCLKRTTSEESLAEDTSQPYEGVQIFAQTIDSGIYFLRTKTKDGVHVYTTMNSNQRQDEQKSSKIFLG